MTSLAGRLQTIVETLHGVARHDQLVAAGVSRRSIHWATDRGYLVRLSRGVFTTALIWQVADRAERHALRIRARQRTNPLLVATGPSAAALRGWPLPWGPPEVPVLTLPRDLEAAGAPGRRGGEQLRRAFVGIAQGEDPEKVLWDEKQRQDAIRDERYEVVRFVMADHGRWRSFHIRYAEALRRAGRHR